VALGYDPRWYVEENRQLQQVLDAISHGHFSHGEPDRYRSLVQPLLQHDPYMLIVDFAAYVRTQGEVDALYEQPAAWTERAIRNVAGMGAFSTDRTIGEYVQKVWATPARHR
jgi:starch phosphorylase